MLSNTLTITDGTTSIDVDLVSRTGTKSIRVDMAAESATARKVTIDTQLPGVPRQRVAGIMNKKYEMPDGSHTSNQISLVISRDDGYPDSEVIKDVAYMLDLYGLAGFVQQIVRGGN